MRGVWGDGKAMVYGGNGYPGSPGATAVECDFMFPGDSDPLGLGTDSIAQNPWDEKSAGNVPKDRRFFQSAGPFTLRSGQVNFITVGVVWARATTGDNQASVKVLRGIDDAAQALFDNNFAKVEGPDSPDLGIRELDGKLIISLSNAVGSNNYKEKYYEKNPRVPNTSPDTNYVFEGYQIIQLADNSVSDIFDVATGRLRTEKAVVVAQSDVQNKISTITNYKLDAATGEWVSYPTIYQAAEPNNFLNQGIKRTFVMTTDAFTGKPLINHKTYYYTAIAYGYNKYEAESKPYISTVIGTKIEGYLSGSNNNKVYKAVPHNIQSENLGTVLNADYGTGVEITRIAGQGNNGNPLAISKQMQETIASSPDAYVNDVTYLQGKGPVNVIVFDPLKLKEADYVLKFDRADSLAKWTLTSDLPGELPEVADKPASFTNEQIIDKWGLSISMNITPEVGTSAVNKNGVLTSPSPVYEDSTRKWLNFIYDGDQTFNGEPYVYNEGGKYFFNWIRSDAGKKTAQGDIDANRFFQKILEGSWAPYALVGSTGDGNGAGNDSTQPGGFINISAGDRLNALSNLNSVALVLTPDKNLWTRSVVVETGDDVQNARLKAKSRPSVDKNGNPATGGGSSTNPDDANYISDKGMGWFPGYAISLETGERLNIVFGENSFDAVNNGNDMIFNPTHTIYNSGRFSLLNVDYALGGRHYIYVVSHDSVNVPRYDAGKVLYSKLSDDNLLVRKAAYKSFGWTSLPYLAAGYDMKNGVPPSRVEFNLLVAKPMKKGNFPGDAPRLPEYHFSTRKLVASKGVLSAAQKAMETIKVVPNPYYASSTYESSQFDNRVKFTNLPNQCKISIYTLGGNLVRVINKDNGNLESSQGVNTDPKNRNVVIDNSVDWDLKNSVGIPIASGLYIIHIKADGVGEKVIRWYGVMRPLDLSNY